MSKTCPICKQEKSEAAFYARSDRPGQYLHGCRSCRLEAAAKKQREGRAAVSLMTAADVLGIYDFDRSTGVFSEKATGRPVTATNGEGYIRLRLAGVGVLAHRAAWLIYHGAWPTAEIDHQDHDRANNRTENLRLAPNGENARNLGLSARNTSGAVGVAWVASRRKWLAQIYAGSTKNLGLYERFDDAVAARKAAEKRLGFHQNHGAAVPAGA